MRPAARKPVQPLPLEAYPPSARPEIARLRAAERAFESMIANAAWLGAHPQAPAHPRSRDEIMSEFAKKRALMAEFLLAAGDGLRGNITPCDKALAGT